MAEGRSVTFSQKNNRDEVVFRPKTRITFGPGNHDEEAGRRGSIPRMSRTTTSASTMSMATIRRRNSIDPAHAIPITFRTVSFAIEETKEREKVEAAKAKKDAAAGLGDLDYHSVSINDLQNRLSTSLVRGLSKEHVAMKQKEFGKNMPSKPPSDLISRVLGYMFGGFGSILLVGLSCFIFVCTIELEYLTLHTTH
jgi:sodium/potassium-transporting ATPase subunit alpha